MNYFYYDVDNDIIKCHGLVPGNFYIDAMGKIIIEYGENLIESISIKPLGDSSCLEINPDIDIDSVVDVL